MKIFIGLSPTVNIAYTYSEGFRILGSKTYSAVNTKSHFYPESQYDVVLNDCIGTINQDASIVKKILHAAKKFICKSKLFLYALSSCNAFIFISGLSFLPKNYDYPILKLFNKKIITVFLGSDIRYWHAYEQEMGILGIRDFMKPYIEHAKKDSNNFFLKKLQKVKSAEQYADLILSQPSFGQLQSLPYMRINIPLDLSLYQLKVPGKKIPIVLHAPSKRSVKGTDFILDSVNKLKSDGIQFEFRLIENMPNNKLRELLTEVDIVIDQLFSQTIAVLSLEAMATGNAVLTGYLHEYSQISSDCPAINITIDTLTAKLRKVIQDCNLRIKLACAGRPYVEKYHSHVNIAQQILDYLKTNGVREYDFYPKFFRKEYVIPVSVLKKEHKIIIEQHWQSLKNIAFPSLKK